MDATTIKGRLTDALEQRLTLTVTEARTESTATATASTPTLRRFEAHPDFLSAFRTDRNDSAQRSHSVSSSEIAALLVRGQITPGIRDPDA